MMKYLNKSIQLILLCALWVLASCQTSIEEVEVNSPVRDTLISIITQNEIENAAITEDKGSKKLKIKVSEESGVQFILDKIQLSSSNERILKLNDKPLIVGELSNKEKKTGEYTIGFSDVGFGDLLLEINLKNIVTQYLLPLKPMLVTHTMESLYKMVEIEEAVQLFPLDSLIHQNLYELNLARKSYPKVNAEIKTVDSALYRKVIELEHQIESNSTNAESFQKLGELYIEINQEELYNTLNRCFIQSLNLGNNNISLIYSLAYSEFLLGNYDRATDHFIKVTQSGWTNDYYDLRDRLEVYLLRRGY